MILPVPAFTASANGHRYSSCIVTGRVVKTIANILSHEGSSPSSILELIASSRPVPGEPVSQSYIYLGWNNATSLTKVLLLVQNIVLGTSNHTRILDTLDTFGDSNTREYWIRTKAWRNSQHLHFDRQCLLLVTHAFPISTTCRISTKWTNYRTELDIHAL